MEVEAIAADIREHGVAAETVIDRSAHDSAAAAVIDAVDARKADFVIMATHGRSGMADPITELISLGTSRPSGVKDALFGSDVERVVREAEFPVLVVPPFYDQPWSIDRDVRIAVALDGSTQAEAAIRPAQALAAALCGSLLLIRVVDVARPSPEVLHAHLADAGAYLETIRQRLVQEGFKAEMRVEIGPKSSTIVHAAEEWSADVLVMATQGRRGLARLAKASVAAETLRRASMPVLIAPEGGASTEFASRNAAVIQQT
jgi:nucleotide-binding universal stress UspA family protein